MTLDQLPDDRCRNAIELLGTLRTAQADMTFTAAEGWVARAALDLRDCGFITLHETQRDGSRQYGVALTRGAGR